jgi:hypothetical protein
MKILNNGLIHPFIFALFPIFVIFSNNPLEITIESLLFPISIIFSIIIFLTILLKKITKNLPKSTLIVSLGLILFFNLEQINSWLTSFELAEIRAHHLTLILYSVTFPTVLYLIYKIKDAKKPSMIITIAGLAILVSFTPNFLMFSEISENPSPNQFFANYELDFDTKPNVYFVLLDGYSSSESLNKNFQFDNSLFLNELEKSGFIIADNIFSNYLWTVFAMTSMLNMDYPQNHPDYSSNDQILNKNLFSHNVVMNLFRDNGYETIYIDGGGPWREMYAADKVLCRSTDNRLLQHLIDTSVMQYLYGGFTSKSWDEIRNCAFNELEKVSQDSDKPLFVYAHIRSPHSPYTYDRDGQLVNYDETLNEKILNERYIYQLKYTNDKLEQVIPNLLSSNTPPVILLLSDHGTKNIQNIDHDDEISLTQFHSNFGAYYLPELTDKKEYLDSSPVNLFRLIFNDYFDGKIERLDDKAFFIEFENFRPTDGNIIDVTEIVN